ncbi:MAG: hypothetical protein BWY74_01888 [Firmicutes bacterium ADurb.Bin419]|nr:MAG: hypothetical protein BWY74_01888 [Firmicutes bacterium ADurb.Bin419]
MHSLTVKEALIEILNNDGISQHLSQEDKNIIIEYYSRFEEQFEKEYILEDSKNRIAGIILYNLVQLDDELKKRKSADNKGLLFSIKSISLIIGIG